MMMMKHLQKRVLPLICAVALLAVAVPASSFDAGFVSAASSTLFYEGFESSSSLPEGWTAYDVDGDGYNWQVNDGGYNGYPSGGNCLQSTSALSWSNYLTPDEWFTLPAIELPEVGVASVLLSFQITTSYMSGYRDYIQVYVSTSPITDPTTLTAEQLLLDETYYTGNGYEEMTADLNAYLGRTVYLAFRHHTATGVWQQYIDDIKVVAEEPDTFRVKFNSEGDVVTVTPENGSFYATDGLDYAFTVTVNEAYVPQNGTLTVTANGEELVAENGVYTIPAVTEKQTVDVLFRYLPGDVTADLAVNMFDIVELYGGVSGSEALNPVKLAAGNIDYIEALNMYDLMGLYEYVSGQRDYIDENRDIRLIWDDAYADSTTGFFGLDSVKRADYYFDGRAIKDYSAPAADGDAKQIFYHNSDARIVNLPEGYVFTLPETDFEVDYSLSELRAHYETDDFVLNISHETQNPYGNNANSWNIYLTEWLNRYVASSDFLTANNITTVRESSSSTTKLSGYIVLSYDLYIENSGTIDMPYYHIAVIREVGEYVNFYLMVMKSTTARQGTMDAIVKSFKEITVTGTASNTQTAFECEVPEYWSDETKAYYNKLQTQSATDWGFFSASMTDRGDSSYNTSFTNIQNEYDRLSTALDYEYEIMPTYTHLGWYSDDHAFPLEQAEAFAGGNGFNGKPVLQFTYQFTRTNNTNLYGESPMFDILRGEYDEQFRTLARDIKAYGKPVLLRLNNEMNTDWTSYCGIVTLLDPDIFVMTWERMYEIFLEEDVDNCIWIFNPFGTTTPYCDWGEDLCYLPDLDYVQILGLTVYETGNSTSLSSFATLYKKLYEKNSPYFDNYPAIISEFAAGAGGEKVYNWTTLSWDTTTLGRNAAKQAQWVEGMFECFEHRDEPGYEYVKNIKGAVWFSCNDYIAINSTNYVTNYFRLDDSLSDTLTALKEGLQSEK